ncbi:MULTISPECIES: COX15/CtaA family protein [Mesonia]|uniref:Heme A synthase n=1 Tax=Mesonia oceanica TaxID=2687242 RepID=A0AC61Y635_9FLAO|nr:MULTISPECIES: COX15/CtaA family protein [Mesonia]MAN27210.1 heme A synthase [Mesonia sp.]MAQ42394.1 heme A synthase [Mesonia sp.]MBJ98682.1 heme A synthase [Flavobacteriaceae bacterium]VVU99900.1 Heme A synthase [Mesonia oceanica]|tara:strand:- start:132421 stop:133437 length:1017 start_codon:yes stop_codon:yes gene_type:complete
MKDNKKVVYWLLTGCTLIFIMVIVGGITRLTNSGLSISNYKLIHGVIPPMNQQEWVEAFELYKQYPEYQKLHYHFNLEDFKDIYFWEWIHRVIGRLIGVVFIIPFLYFLFTKQLTKSTIKKAIILLLLGGFQGFMGWYMVKSGLVDRPSVSHYRLAAHLMTAFITFAYSFWVALDIIYKNNLKPAVPKMKKWIWIGMIVLILQITWGAFVAGLDAGFIHNYWPFMAEGKLIHETVYIEQKPLLKNFISGKSGVQFVHRYLAYFVVAAILIIWFKAKKLVLTKAQQNGINTLLIIVFVQFLLGIFTLIYQVPVWLGVTHQVGAFFLLATMTFVLHRFSK